MATMDIKQMLQNGSTPEDLKEALNSQITRALEEIRDERRAAAAENAKKIEIEETRENVIDALLDYLTALGVFDDVDDDFDIDGLAEELNEQLKKEEKAILAAFNLFKEFELFSKDNESKDSWGAGYFRPADSTKATQTPEKTITAKDADAILRSFLNKI